MPQGMWSGMVAWYQNVAVGGVFARTGPRATVAADANPPACHAVNEVGAHPCAPVVSDRGRARGQRYGHAKACPARVGSVRAGPPSRVGRPGVSTIVARVGVFGWDTRSGQLESAPAVPFIVGSSAPA